MEKADRTYRLAALDMDGTLLDSNNGISPYSRRVLQRAAEAGRVVALCTGRCLSQLRTFLDANPAIGYVIAESGGCLYDARNHAVLRQMLLPTEPAERILRAAKEYDVCFQVFIDNQSYMCLPPGTQLARYHLGEYEAAFRMGALYVDDILAVWQEHGMRADKINLYFASEADRARFQRVLEPMGLGVCDSMGLGFEISPAEASKSTGLAELCAHVGIDIGDTLAVGDGGNDLDIMSAAGFSVAMGNAIPQVKALADAVTGDCDHDGAARAMVRYMGLGEI